MKLVQTNSSPLSLSLTLSGALPLTAQLAALALITQILSKEQQKKFAYKYNKIHYDELHRAYYHSNQFEVLFSSDVAN